MTILKLIFSVLTILFGALGIMELMPYKLSMPIMFVFLGLSMLTNAKEYYDKGAKRDAMIFCGIAILVFAVTIYNVISSFI